MHTQSSFEYEAKLTYISNRYSSYFSIWNQLNTTHDQSKEVQPAINTHVYSSMIYVSHCSIWIRENAHARNTPSVKRISQRGDGSRKGDRTEAARNGKSDKSERCSIEEKHEDNPIVVRHPKHGETTKNWRYNRNMAREPKHGETTKQWRDNRTMV